MKPSSSLSVALSALTILTVVPATTAHDTYHHVRHNRRQAPPQPSGDPYAPAPIAGITSGAPNPPPVPIPTTYTAGAQPSLTGAPPLPTYTKILTDWPLQDRIPPTDTTEVRAWLEEIEGVDIPNIPVNSVPDPFGDLCNTAPQTARDSAAQNAWWTCGGHMTPDDVSRCPVKQDWGLSFDDGPSDYTPKLLKWLDDHNLKATFFVVGSRVIQRPDVVRAMHMKGHEISVHTWSHTPLTLLTNEQIVAELGYTREAIRQITGVSPTTYRPPRGDVDNRVRAIATAMGLVDLLWTATPEGEFDTEDFRVVAGEINGQQAVAQFGTLLDRASGLDTGFIVLQHDLYFQTVDLAIGAVLPDALTRNFKLKTINSCLGKPDGAAYVETSNSTDVPSGSGTGSSTRRPTSTSSGTARPTNSNGPNAAAPGTAVSASLVAAAAGVGAFVLGIAQLV